MLEAGEIQALIAEFMADLERRSARDIVRMRILSGNCAVISPEQYAGLREAVASNFHLHPNEVVVVGSSKLGFSTAPSKVFRPFGDHSDIDVVLASSVLFDAMWKSVYDYWYEGGYWERQSEFKKYLFQGWIRPDKLPPSDRFAQAHEWWNFFRELTASRNFGPYKISCALYKEWHFLESYQMKSITLCGNSLRANP